MDEAEADVTNAHRGLRKNTDAKVNVSVCVQELAHGEQARGVLAVREGARFILAGVGEAGEGVEEIEWASLLNFAHDLRGTALIDPQLRHRAAKAGLGLDQ